MEAFVYTWTNLETNQLYIGSHKGTSDDGYVCSSKPMLEDYMKNRSVFSRQIIATGTHEDMVAFEAALLHSVDAKNDSQFYNMHNGNGKYTHNQPHTEDALAKMRKAHENRTYYAKGHKFSVVQLERHKKGLRNFWDNLSEEERKVQAEIRETPKKRVSLAKRNHEVRTCLHCGKQGKGFGMDRWHMNNCRHKS